MFKKWRYNTQLPGKLDKKIQKKHALILGKTGCGKSNLLLTIAYNLIKNDKKVIIIDPHGNLVEQALQFDLFHKNPNSFAYLNPTLDVDYRLGINPFYSKEYSRTSELYAGWRSNAFMKLLGNHSLSMQMETLLKPALMVVFCNEKCDFETLQQLFILEKDDPVFQELILEVPGATQRFLKGEFHNPRYKNTKTAIYTRLQHFMNFSVLHQLFNGKQTIAIGEELVQGKSLLINLSKSNLGSEVSTILGKFLMANLLSIFFGNQHQTKETYLLVDEAHLLGDKTLDSLITEVRKRGLFFIGVSQSIGQFSSSFKKRLLNNVSVHFLGKHYDTDINDFKRAMSIDKEMLGSLRPYHFIVKAEDSSPFVIRSPKGLLGRSPKMYYKSNQVKAIIRIQLEKYYAHKTKQYHIKNQQTSLKPKF